MTILKRVMCLLCLLILSMGAKASITISGPTTVCAGSSQYYTIATSAGHHYSWSCNPNGSVVGTPTGGTAQINWSNAGTGILYVYEYDDLTSSTTNSGTLNPVTIIAVPTPHITTNTQVACQQSVPDPPIKDGHQASQSSVILDDANGCIKVCENSIVEYYANGTPGNNFQWTVVGGTPIGPTNGSTLIVQWGAAGTAASVKLVETTPAPPPSGCSGEKTICITIIQKPTALFAVDPDPNPAGVVHVCLNTLVSFHDLSSPVSGQSPIIDWHWDFGDPGSAGNVSPLQNPTHTYAHPGTYTVELTVTNACGCKDKYKAQIVVEPDAGPPIVCGAVVCENDTASYSTPLSCGNYIWNVDGGTIIAGIGTDHIVVRWDNVGPSGFGSVSLTTPGCTHCDGTTVLKIPVVQSNPTVDGPTVMCAGKNYELRLPLWPGTQYHWGVIGYPSAITGDHIDHKVELNFPTPGTYTVHVWWQNRVRVCGGDLKFHVTVTDQPTITGVKDLCSASPNNTGNFALSNGSNADWTLYSAGNTVITTSTGATAFNYTFSAAGDYTLAATNLSGTVCDPDPIIIHIQQSPIAPTAISGPLQICPTFPYTYTAVNTVPGTTLIWTATNGTVNGTTSGTGNTATVVWNAVGPYDLHVRRMNLAAPYCESGNYTITATPYPINPNVQPVSPITNTPCANSYQNFTANYAIGDVYNWTVIPATAGSVMSGNYTQNVTILWNNVTSSTPATVKCEVTKCNTTVASTYSVTVLPLPVLSITPHAAVCRGISVVFNATPGAASYLWDYGDGSPAVTTTTNTSLPHPYNPSGAGGSVTYTVKVKATGTATGLSGCPPFGIATSTITINKGPQVNISTTGQTVYCNVPPPVVSTPLNGSVSGTSGTVTYQWYQNGVLISGATAINYTATAAGTYQLVVSDGSGCPQGSNLIPINIVSCGGGGTGCGTNPTLTASFSCNKITATAGGIAYTGTNQNWYYPPGATGISYPTSNSIALTYPHVGYYQVSFTEDYGSCTGGASVNVLIPLVGDYRYDWTCSSPNYTLNLVENSEIYPGFSISSVTWNIPGVGTFTGSPNYSIALAPGTYSVTETITVSNGTLSSTCNITKTIIVPVKPSVGFTKSTVISAATTAPIDICDQVPVNFNPVIIPAPATGAVVQYLWSFGDATFNTQSNPQRSYTWAGPPNPMVVTPKLTFTDELGCISTTPTQTVRVFKNQLGGPITGSTEACSGSSIALVYGGTGSPTSYEWAEVNTTGILATTTIPSYTVYATGNYVVTVHDVYACQKESNPVRNVKFYPSPEAIITGQLTYCDGETIRLDGYTPTPGATYTWYLDGSPVAYTPQYTTTLPVGSHTIQLQVKATYGSVTCFNITAIQPLIIYALPADPWITGPTVISCPDYELQLDGSHSSGATSFYNWSNGVSGQTDQIFSGGGYRLWFTDPNGCRSHTDINVPLSPRTYFPWFPSGCYTICNTQFPFDLYGPPGNFAGWKWISTPGPGTAGSGPVSPYTIAGPQTLSLLLDNGLCSDITDPMNIDEKDCKQCKKVIISDGTTVVCDPSNPHGYIVTVNIDNPAPGTNYVIGFDIGPMVPFSFTLMTPGTQTLTFNFTTLQTAPPPTVGEIDVHYTLPNGQECFDKEQIKLPTCTWTPERPAANGSTASTSLSTGLMVYPNPASQQVTVQYNFGAESTVKRHILIYDMMGRAISSHDATTATGAISVPTSELAAGSYMVRMEEGGQTVHTQKLIISH